MTIQTHHHSVPILAAAIAGGWLLFGALPTLAAPSSETFNSASLPFELSKNSVLAQGSLRIGDLSVATDEDIESIEANASTDRAYLEKCMQAALPSIALSEDGTVLELRPPYGTTLKDKVQAAYCEEGVIFLGGSTQRSLGEGAPTTSWTLFWDARHSSPVKVTQSSPFAVGSWPRQSRYNLTAVRAIDPDEKRVLFVASNGKSGEILLVAPFEIVRRDD